MGDLDNAPMPPMGADGMGGEDPMGGDPMGGGMDDMGGDMPQGPDDMEGDPNEDIGGDMPQGPDDMGGEEGNELMGIFDNLSVEDKAAVIKYAKSMSSDEGGDEPMEMGDEMPMESRKRFKRIIDETINDVLDDYEGMKRPQKKLPNCRRIMTPFTPHQ